MAKADREMVGCGLLHRWYILTVTAELQTLTLTAGLSDDATRYIREEYSNARNFCDGDIYRHLRHHQMQQNAEESGKWLARLSESKRKGIRQLREKMQPLCSAFDRLLPIIGL